MKGLFKLTGASAALVMSMSANAAIIDTFTDPDAGDGEGVQYLQEGDGTSFNQGWDHGRGTIIGGYRDMILRADNGTSSGGDGTCTGASFCAEAIVNLSPNEGALTYSEPSSDQFGSELTLQWDGDDSGSIETLNYTGLGGENLIFQEGCPPEGCTDFVFEVFSTDHDFSFSVGVYTDAMNWSVWTLEATEPAGLRNIPIAAFAATGFCGLDQSNDGGALDEDVISVECYYNGGTNMFQAANVINVGALELVLNTGVLDASGNVIDGTRTARVDLSLGGVTKERSIPEPATIALLGLGLVAGGFARRRKTKA